MPAGLQLYAPNGRPLIDTNFLIYGLVKSGTMGVLKSGWEWDTYGFRVNATAPIVFVEGGAVFYTSTRSGNNWTFYFSQLYDNPQPAPYRFGWPAGVPKPSNLNPNYFVFDLMQPNKSRTGLEVRNPQGQVIFNSDQWPLNIAGSLLPPPVQTGSNHRPPYARISGWTYNTSPPLNHGQTASRTFSSIGLTGSRRYAWNLPWRRGARGYGGGDQYTLFEAMATHGGVVGFTWQEDPFGQYTVSGNQYYAVYNVHEQPVLASFVDVSDLPLPFEY